MRVKHFFPLAAGVFVLALLLIAPVAHAQRGGRGFRAAPPMTARHSSTAFARAPSRTNRRSSNGFFGNSFAGTSLFSGRGVGINGINTLLTPGNLGVEAAINPATQWDLALAERLGRIFPGSGFYLLSGGYGYALPEEDGEQPATPAQQQQPQVIVLQQQPPAAQQAGPQASEQSAAPPLPDAGQFTLVLRGGKQIEAVAFTKMKDSIVYIALDGSRHSLPVSDLDANATIRINQERGTPLQLPL